MRFFETAGAALLLCTLSLPFAWSKSTGTAGPANLTGTDSVYEQLLQQLQQLEGPVPERPPVYPTLALYNAEAVIPPQCYTRTDAQYNPCYVCHQAAVPGRENRMDDGVLQQEYQFSEVGLSNHWQNLFEDRSARVAAIGEEEILAWIDEDNYSALAPRLRAAGFKGWIPDLTDLQSGTGAFDENGMARDGSAWVAFNYKPMPSTFWPTNGSTDDVMIRLAPEMRQTAAAIESEEVYRANLALVEANIKGMPEITTRPLNEAVIGADLDGDGVLATAIVIRNTNHYVGAAAGWFKQDWLYPLGTEFLHTVRYIGIGADDQIQISRRMKEVRYMRKQYVLPQFALNNAYREEAYAKADGYLPGYIDQGQHGLDNEMGWLIQGFIEDRKGLLRASTFEENLFCMGCHTSVGATIDKVFSFARKVDGADGWGYINLRGMPDAPNRGELRGEIATYLERVGGGGEFRNNPEMQERWFDAEGKVDHDLIAEAKDVYTLITPSRERALELNKAYRVLVEDQDYIYGRDATVTPPANVYREIDPASVPTLSAEQAYRWDIRLDWDQASPNEVP